MVAPEDPKIPNGGTGGPQGDPKSPTFDPKISMSPHLAPKYPCPPNGGTGGPQKYPTLTTKDTRGAKNETESVKITSIFPLRQYQITNPPVLISAL